MKELRTAQRIAKPHLTNKFLGKQGADVALMKKQVVFTTPNSEQFLHKAILYSCNLSSSF